MVWLVSNPIITLTHTTIWVLVGLEPPQTPPQPPKYGEHKMYPSEHVGCCGWGNHQLADVCFYRPSCPETRRPLPQWLGASGENFIFYCDGTYILGGIPAKWALVWTGFLFAPVPTNQSFRSLTLFGTHRQSWIGLDWITLPRESGCDKYLRSEVKSVDGLV